MDGSAWIYEDRAQFAFHELLESLNRHGITLWYPAKEDGEYVSLLTDEGEQVITSRHDFLARLRGQPPVLHLQLWFSLSADLYCRIRFINQLAVVDFGFRGLELNERLLVIGAIQEELSSRARQGRLRGIVVDGDGQVEEYDWDRFFIRGESLSTEWQPDILGVEPERLGQVDSRILGKCCKLDLSRFVLLRKFPVSWER